MKWWQIYLIAVAIMSVISFVLYAADKVKAKQKAWRTPEKALLLSSFLLGALFSVTKPSIGIFMR